VQQEERDAVLAKHHDQRVQTMNRISSGKANDSEFFSTALFNSGNQCDQIGLAKPNGRSLALDNFLRK
jgi:hypothetical protein